ncbi:MAG: hypothetical protein NTU53_11120 [Planctomycetota bacterium]|nr:hypothetical protein [Planctomycetota bacterium]
MQHILRIRVEKALHAQAVGPGVVEKIAALASRDHGDARQAVALLAKSAYLAEKTGSHISLPRMDEAASVIEHDRYLTMVRTAPVQMRAVLSAVIEAAEKADKEPVGTGDAYDAYRVVCDKAQLCPLSTRAFADLVAELDLYSLVRTRVLSHGRYGRTREIILDLPEDVLERIKTTIGIDLEMRR